MRSSPTSGTTHPRFPVGFSETLSGDPRNHLTQGTQGPSFLSPVEASAVTGGCARANAHGVSKQVTVIQSTASALTSILLADRDPFSRERSPLV